MLKLIKDLRDVSTQIVCILVTCQLDHLKEASPGTAWSDPSIDRGSWEYYRTGSLFPD